MSLVRAFFGVICGGCSLILILYLYGEWKKYDIELTAAKIKHTQSIEASKPKLNKAVMILFVTSNRGNSMISIPGYASMDDCNKAEGTTRSKWYGGAILPVDMQAAYSCIP